MPKTSEEFNKTRYNYLKGHAFKSEQCVEGFIEGLDENGFMKYKIFGNKDIARKGILEFDTRVHIIKVDYRKTNGLIELVGDPLVRDRRARIRINVSKKIHARNYREEEPLTELQLINISSIGILCEKPNVRLILGECIECLEAYYKVIRIDKTSIGMELKYSPNEQAHRSVMMGLIRED